jgi:hypothetical protein
LHGERIAMMLPDISIGTKPDNYTPFRTLRIVTFGGTSWTFSGDPLSADWTRLPGSFIACSDARHVWCV